MISVFLKIFTVVFLRYNLLSATTYYVFYIKFKEKFLQKKIQKNEVKSQDIQREYLYSVITLIIFAIQGLIIYKTPLRNYSLLYNNIDDYGWIYLVSSFFIALLIHDTYFYWTHRFMHIPFIYKHSHYIHHKSINPTPFAAFSFHPLEAILEGGIVWILAFLIPMHENLLLFFLFFSNALNVYGHLGYEILPKNFQNSTLKNIIISSFNHNMHHRYFNGNYGLYFIFWDNFMNTTFSNYNEKLKAYFDLGKKL